MPIDNIGTVLGLLIDMLMCQVDPSSDLSIIQLVRNVKQDYLDILPHKYGIYDALQHLKTSAQDIPNW